MQTIAQLFDLEGMGAIVTGGAKGIGQGIAMRLAEAGASVMISDIDMESARLTAQQIKDDGGKARAIQADVRKALDANKVAQATSQAFGSLDILVNNAGIYPFKPALKISEDMWDKVIDINLKGVFLSSQSAAKEMIKSGRGGKIINIASVDALKPSGLVAHYNASKAGVVMLTKAMALELAPHQILVNAVAPGHVMTSGTEEGAAALQAKGIDVEANLNALRERIPIDRFATPDDIARVVLFLASAAADYMTGSLLVVDGGSLLS